MEQSMKKKLYNEQTDLSDVSCTVDRKPYQTPEIKRLGSVKKITLNGEGPCPDSGATWDAPFGDCNATS